MFRPDTCFSGTDPRFEARPTDTPWRMPCGSHSAPLGRAVRQRGQCRRQLRPLHTLFGATSPTRSAARFSQLRCLRISTGARWKRPISVASRAPSGVLMSQLKQLTTRYRSVARRELLRKRHDLSKPAPPRPSALLVARPSPTRTATSPTTGLHHPQPPAKPATAIPRPRPVLPGPRDRERRNTHSHPKETSTLSTSPMWRSIGYQRSGCAVACLSARRASTSSARPGRSSYREVSVPRACAFWHPASSFVASVRSSRQRRARLVAPLGEPSEPAASLRTPSSNGSVRGQRSRPTNARPARRARPQRL